MCIRVKVLDKYKMSYGTEVEVRYTCPHCGETIEETICFSGSQTQCVASIEDHECPDCAEYNDLDVDLY